MRSIARILTALVAIVACTTSCLKDDMSDCPDPQPGADLRFIFTHHDHTETRTDLFTDHVDDVHVYIFDVQDRYVYHVDAMQPDLTGGNTLRLDLDEGEYKIVVWGNLYGTGYEVNESGETTRNTYTVEAKENHNSVADLFHGTIDITIGDTPVTHEVELIRNTHIVRVMLLGLPAPTSRTPVDDTDYEVHIEGSNTIYNFDNQPAGGTAAIYTPEYSGYYHENNYVVQSEFKVQRLSLGDDVTLRITGGGQPIKEDNLAQRILYAYNEIETNDDLDKHYIYELFYELDYFGGWIFVGNNIKDWSGTTQPGEL